MPSVEIQGIRTRYEVTGDGPPLLLFSPGGFDATLENWSSLSVYAELRLLDHLPQRFRCIAFDRRESGQSGGRVERVTWRDYAEQAAGLLDYLGVERANLLGGCAGCSVAVAFGVAFPQRTTGLVLFWPAGGPRYRIKQHQRMAEHLVFVAEHGLRDVVRLATSTSAGFSKDPRVGPWVTVIRTDPTFAKAYAEQDASAYTSLAQAMVDGLFDRDTVAGAEPTELMELEVPALIVPGDDPSHSRSAARYLQECLPRADYWDVSVGEQTGATVPPRIVDFLTSI